MISKVNFHLIFFFGWRVATTTLIGTLISAICETIAFNRELLYIYIYQTSLTNDVSKIRYNTLVLLLLPFPFTPYDLTQHSSHGCLPLVASLLAEIMVFSGFCVREIKTCLTFSWWCVWLRNSSGGGRSGRNAWASWLNKVAWIRPVSSSRIKENKYALLVCSPQSGQMENSESEEQSLPGSTFLQDWQHICTKLLTLSGRYAKAFTRHRNFQGTMRDDLMLFMVLKGMRGCSVIVQEVWSDLEPWGSFKDSMISGMCNILSSFLPASGTLFPDNNAGVASLVSVDASCLASVASVFSGTEFKRWTRVSRPASFSPSLRTPRPQIVPLWIDRLTEASTLDCKEKSHRWEEINTRLSGKGIPGKLEQVG